MNKSDFILARIDDKFEDYWFSVGGDTATYLTNKYMEQSMVAVTDVVYSKKEDKLGIKRVFPFNYDVIIPNDTDLKELILKLIREKIK